MLSSRLWVYLWLYGDDCDCVYESRDDGWSGMVVMGSLTMKVNLHDVLEQYGDEMDEKIALRLTYEKN